MMSLADGNDATDKLENNVLGILKLKLIASDVCGIFQVAGKHFIAFLLRCRNAKNVAL